jgi:putative solute:sodium symporter small subunit
MQLTELQEQYWQKNLSITAKLMAVWFVVTFVVTFFARDLSFTFFGWPFSFWMASQGSLIIYVLIIWYYASYMNKIDQEHGVAEEEGE